MSGEPSGAMSNPHFLKKTPWDSRALGCDTYEITEYSEAALREALKTTGHFAIRVEPLEPKMLLHTLGFYYCDTLIEPYCGEKHFIPHENSSVSISRPALFDELLAICDGAFTHGRFHRDFSISPQCADLRYNLWLKDLHDAGTLWPLHYENDLAGFFGYSGNKIVLHALSSRYRGKNLAKYFWSLACREMFSRGNREIFSSVSASNAAIINLYASLGFRFRNPSDVYHFMNGSIRK